MSETERDRRDDREGIRGGSSEEAVEAIAGSTLRVVLLILGVLLLLYATGQVVGIDVLAMISESLDMPEARWLLVAFFALVLITLALRGFD